LGKTYEALAVIKFFELKNERVLVLCPKRLRENWAVYRRNDQLNPFVDDRFRYDVLFHTDLSRERGYSGDINLETLNWGNYDLVVIDESHNFRNNAPGRRDDTGVIVRRSRYERLMQEIIQRGINTKVLLLSATPVNNDLKDLRNQIYFITAGRDDAFKESIGIADLKEMLRQAQGHFSNWAKQLTPKRKTADLLARLGSDFFKVLDELTIARARKHIQKYYDHEMDRLGRFPERPKLISISPDTDTAGCFMSYDRLSEEIDGYTLSLFNPSRFLRPDLPTEIRAEYERKVGNFTQAQREGFLIGMMKVNFLKRLEISVHSFELTMQRTMEKIETLEDLDDTVALTEFTLDDFRVDLLKYIEANRAQLEESPFGLYTVVPPHAEIPTISPGVIFCLRQREGHVSSPSMEQVNPLQPYFLVYVMESGDIRFGFAHPKQILTIYRELCTDKPESYQALCNLFDQRTQNGRDMAPYDKLLQRAVDAIASTFRKRVATGLQSGRNFVIPNQHEQANETTDFELVTWLVILTPVAGS